MTYRCLRGQAPRYLGHDLTPSSVLASHRHLRSANRHQLIITRRRLNTYGRRAFSIACPTVWNSLPGELKDPACDSDSFKRFLNAILFCLYQCDQRIRECSISIHVLLTLFTYFTVITKDSTTPQMCQYISL